MKYFLFIFAIATAHAEEKNFVMAMDPSDGTALHAGSIVMSKASTRVLIDKKNVKIEMGPHSVGEFAENGKFKLYRGSAVVDAPQESEITTTNAAIDFVGTLVLSYDYKEKSTSSFVISGEARVKNPSEADKTLRLERNQGASMLTGDIYPLLIRSLDLTKVDDWMARYEWSQSKRSIFLASVPKADFHPAEKPAEGKEKLTDYFAAIVNPESQPHYYEDKLAAMKGEEAIPRNTSLQPEVAAMLQLPEKNILKSEDFFAEVVGHDGDVPGLTNLDTKSTQEPPKKVERKLASLEKVTDKPKKTQSSSSVDSDVQNVLNRLQGLQNNKSGANGNVVRVKSRNSRAPASVTNEPSSTIVPDRVYDYSENF